MVWAKLTPSSKLVPSQPLNLDILNDRLQVTKDVCEDIDGALNGSHEYAQDGLAGAISQLVAVLEREWELSENRCELYLLHNETVMLLASKARELKSQDFCMLCQLLTVLGDRDGLGSSVDRRIVLTLTMFQNKMLSYGTMERSQEEALSKLLYAVAARMRATPRILSEWFDIVGIAAASGGTRSDGSGQCQQQFPLLYLLIDYAYRENAVGEYARTGLLFLVDAISLWPEYEQWILQSNLCTLLASGLGALYSQLNRSVARDSSLVASIPPIVAATALFDEGSAQTGAVNDSLVSFINYVLFWQDLIKGRRSDRLKQSLMHHFDSLFVQQILMPSLFESADDKGDYSVAVISILRCLLETLEFSGDLSHLILTRFLKTGRSTSVSDEEQPINTPLLKDVIIACLDSKTSSKVRVVAMQLLSTLCNKYYPYVMGCVLSTIASERQKMYPEYLVIPQLRTLRAIQRDLGADTLMENEYLRDIELKLVGVPYLTPMQLESLLPVELEHIINNSPAVINEELTIHDLDPEDEIMKRVYGIIQCFFSNSAEVNLALTGLLVDIGACSWCTLTSWLLESEPEYPSNGSPKVIGILQQLSYQYQHCLGAIEDLEEKMSEFEQRLANAEETHFKRPHTPPQSSGRTPDGCPLSQISNRDILDEGAFIARAIKRSFSANLALAIPIERNRARSASASNYLYHSREQSPVRVNQICGNIYLLREFVKEIEALVRIRSWLVD
ncbi:hypothetical protein TRVA0_005S01706 [Trichomonascus vanleenenianus]|uniref:uncharacterized protein n=1 Tax=Trichomonascus vanleenenianus TaxID=2268995 RepID=UPI003ECA7618